MQRDDIQGVRAIGIMLIVIFHIWVGKVSGGVDVLFVISGFLMTQSLMRRQADLLTTTFSFWSRVALRILPTAFIIIAATVLYANLLGPPQEVIDTHQHALASTFQLENLYLRQLRTDYLNRDLPPSALQHFWALSLQMQVFFVLPFLIFAMRALRARGGAVAEAALPAAVLVGSLAFALLATADNPVPAYFDPRTRLWEFMAGVLGALFVARGTMVPRVTALALGWAGLALIIACGFVVPVAWPYPGYAALVPVTGALALLIAGANQRNVGSANAMLAWPPLASLGRYAFTLLSVALADPHLRHVFARNHAARPDTGQCRDPGRGGAVMVHLSLHRDAATRAGQAPEHGRSRVRPGGRAGPHSGVRRTGGGAERAGGCQLLSPEWRGG